MKILLILIFSLLFNDVSTAKDNQSYCLWIDSFLPYRVSQHEIDNDSKFRSYCDELRLIEIPKTVFDKLNNEDNYWYQKSGEDDPDTSFFSKKTLRENPAFMKKREEALKKIYMDSTEEIKLFNLNRSNEFKKFQNAKIDKENKLKITELEKTYAGKCNFGYTKGTDKYNNCLLEQEKKALAEQKKKQDLAEANKKKSETEAKQSSEKLAKMTPDDRRAFTCSEKFGFRKGSDNFKDCVFKIYSAEIELEKIELQKQLAKANADLAKANAASNEKLANAQTNAAIMQAYAAQQQAIAANTADSLALMESGLRMLSPQRPAARAPMNCHYHAKMLSCF
ncbi:hypothetical protein MCEME17_00360 [Candidatus Pelagibacterales bacterium]